MDWLPLVQGRLRSSLVRPNQVNNQVNKPGGVGVQSQLTEAHQSLCTERAISSTSKFDQMNVKDACLIARSASPSIWFFQLPVQNFSLFDNEVVGGGMEEPDTAGEFYQTIWQNMNFFLLIQNSNKIQIFTPCRRCSDIYRAWSGTFKNNCMFCKHVQLSIVYMYNNSIIHAHNMVNTVTNFQGWLNFSHEGRIFIFPRKMFNIKKVTQCWTIIYLIVHNWPQPYFGTIPEGLTIAPGESNPLPNPGNYYLG